MSALPRLKAKQRSSVPNTCSHEAAEWLMARDTINHLDYRRESQNVHCVHWAKPMQCHTTHRWVVRHAPLPLLMRSYQHCMLLVKTFKLVKYGNLRQQQNSPSSMSLTIWQRFFNLQAHMKWKVCHGCNIKAFLFHSQCLIVEERE